MSPITWDDVNGPMADCADCRQQVKVTDRYGVGVHDRAAYDLAMKRGLGIWLITHDTPSTRYRCPGSGKKVVG